METPIKLMSNKSKIRMTPLWQIHQNIVSYYDTNYLMPFMAKRTSDHIHLRQLFQYLSKRLNGRVVSYETIGKYYSDVTGNSWSHATVINAEKKVQNYIETERSYRVEILEILETFPKRDKVRKLIEKIKRIEDKSNKKAS